MFRIRHFKSPDFRSRGQHLVNAVVECAGLKQALGANALIFAHNHPSGDLEPSPEDKKLAETLSRACMRLGIRLLDNIIWTEAGSTSYGPNAR